MKITYMDGSIREAEILALRGGTMRVAIRGCEDAAELSLINDKWLSEELTPISFDFSWGSGGLTSSQAEYARAPTSREPLQTKRVATSH